MTLCPGQHVYSEYRSDRDDSKEWMKSRSAEVYLNKMEEMCGIVECDPLPP